MRADDRCPGCSLGNRLPGDSHAHFCGRTALLVLISRERGTAMGEAGRRAGESATGTFILEIERWRNSRWWQGHGVEGWKKGGDHCQPGGYSIERLGG